MDNDLMQQQGHRSRLLWLPFLLITISVIIALFELAFTIYYYPYYRDPYSLALLVNAIYGLVLPLFVLGIALLLLLLTKARKGIATWSRLLFCGGAVLLIISGILLALYDWGLNILLYELPYRYGWFSELFFFYSRITEVLGIAICAISSLLITRAYMNDEIYAKRG